MIKFKYFHDTEEFLEFNKIIISNNYFIFFSCIKSMLSPEVGQVYELYNITDEDGSSAYCLFYSGNYCIHSFKWNSSIVDALAKKIDFGKFRHWTFTGQRQLVSDLLHRNNVKYELLKNRIIYECKRTKLIDNEIGHIELAGKSDSVELSQMALQYHQDEYKERAYRNYEHMNRIVHAGILNKNLYYLKYYNEICTMAQVILDGELPLIGMLYTKDQYRNKGLATTMIYQLSNFLLSNDHEKCGLLSDADNPSSNAIFKKIGFEPIYEQISALKREW